MNTLESPQNNPSSLQHMRACLEASGEYRVLEKLPVVQSYHQTSKANLKKALFVDVETTGLEPSHASIIEIGLVMFDYDTEGQIYTIIEKYQSFQDPKVPLSKEVTALTGITDEMVKNQAIDMMCVQKMLAEVDLVIAHNAKFDRQFLVNLAPEFKQKPWACTFGDIDWAAYGIASRKLDYLAYQYGFYFDGHRAIEDCLASIHLLALKIPNTVQSTMQVLLENARKITVKLWAVYAPFEKKDLLKARGYRWSNGEKNTIKSWYVELPEEKLQEELDYLAEYVFGRACDNLPVDKLTALNRFA